MTPRDARAITTIPQVSNIYFSRIRDFPCFFHVIYIACSCTKHGSFSVVRCAVLRQRRVTARQRAEGRRTEYSVFVRLASTLSSCRALFSLLLVGKRGKEYLPWRWRAEQHPAALRKQQARHRRSTCESLSFVARMPLARAPPSTFTIKATAHVTLSDGAHNGAAVHIHARMPVSARRAHTGAKSGYGPSRACGVRLGHRRAPLWPRMSPPGRPSRRRLTEPTLAPPSDSSPTTSAATAPTRHRPRRLRASRDLARPRRGRVPSRRRPPAGSRLLSARRRHWRGPVTALRRPRLPPR